jgi:hypothetical protein
MKDVTQVYEYRYVNRHEQNRKHHSQPISRKERSKNHAQAYSPSASRRANPSTLVFEKLFSTANLRHCMLKPCNAHEQANDHYDAEKQTQPKCYIIQHYTYLLKLIYIKFWRLTDPQYKNGDLWITQL